MKRFFSRCKDKIVGFFAALKQKKLPQPAFMPQRNFWLYLLLLVLALIFTQALRSSVSGVIFLFMLFLPIISLLYLLLEVLTVKLYLNTSTAETEKYAPVEFSLALSNESPLPFPFVEAIITVPSDDAVRCDSQRTKLSLIPFGSYVIEKKLAFSYRGSYEIGVSEIYCYDFLRLFRYRMQVNLFRDLFVQPRRFSHTQASSGEQIQEETETTVLQKGQDNTEMSDIRDYQPGDSLRSIHWKLSSKTQDMKVRQYARNAEQQTVIFADTGRRFDPSDKRFLSAVNELATDGVVEAALAIADHTLQKGGQSVVLSWFDSRSESGYCSAQLYSPADLDDIFKLFATAPITDTPYPVTELASFVEENAQSVSFVFVSGALDDQLTAALTSLQLPSGIQTDLYAFDPVEQVAPEARSAFFDAQEAHRAELSRYGIRCHDIRSELLQEEVRA